MRLAIIGSRSVCECDLEAYLPKGVTEIVSGGARGVDQLAAIYAREHNIPLVEFFPDYAHYGKGGPLKRNQQIAEYAEEALAFWDGKSRGTAHTMDLFRRLGKPVTVILIERKKQEG